MGLKVGYNWVQIVVISVPTPVGRPKTFSIATYVALKGRLPPKVSEAAWAERFPPICLVRNAFIGLGAFYNWMQIVMVDVPILLGSPQTFAPLVATCVATMDLISTKLDSRLFVFFLLFSLMGEVLLRARRLFFVWIPGIS